MTLRVNPEFAAVLGAATATNTTWSNAFKSGLGDTRRVICKIASAGTPQENVYATGTKFRDAALTGTMMIEGGIVTSYGVTSNLITALAADLNNGVAVLRIEGGGNWIEGTLGLVGSNCDFVLPVNPTATNSIAVLPNLRIKPPPFLASGTGFAPPALDAEAPAYVRFMNWQNPADPVEIGRVYFNKRIENWTFTDPEIAAAMGDVRVTQSTDMITYGNTKYGYFEFSAMLMSMNSAANGSENKTLHQTLINCKPTSDPAGNWPRYPRLGGYRRGTRSPNGIAREYGLSKTFPPPFKAQICRADGFVVFTHEMRDGLPINSEELCDFPTLTRAVRPKWHCAQMLFWQSHEPKLNPNRQKFFSGIDARALRPSHNKEKAAVNGVYPMYDSVQRNGLEQWYAVNKWPHTLGPSNLFSIPSQDPYLYSQAANSNESTPWRTPQWFIDWGAVSSSEAGSAGVAMSLIQGWGFEPGSFCMHNHYTGPGSVRVDRGSIPGPIAIHMSDPNWVHLRQNTPIAEMVRHWNMGYFNHGYHYFTGAAGFETLPLAELHQSKWSYGRGYYNGNDSYVSGGVEYSVPQLAPSNPDRPLEPYNGYPTDENNWLPWNGYCIDGLHDYTTPFFTAAFYSSPAHAYAQKHRYIAHLLVMGPAAPSSNMLLDVGLRSHAWMLIHEVHMWKMASDHPNGIRRDDVFPRLVGLFNSVYRDLYVPLYDTNDQSVYFKCMRNFGLQMKFNNGRWECRSFSLHYYIVGVLVQMRTLGLWPLLWNHSETVQKGMLMVLRMLDTGAIDYALRTKMIYSGSTFSGAPFMCLDNTNQTGAEVPSDYTDWINRVVATEDKTFATDLVTKADGTPRQADMAEMLKAQWIKARKDYFSDIPCAYDLNAAVALVDGWLAKRSKVVTDMEAAGSSKRAISQAEWSAMPPYAILNPPAVPLA